MTEVLFNELTMDEKAYDLARRKLLWHADREAEMDWAMTKGREEGLAEGLEKGEDKAMALNQKLIDLNRFDDLKKATTDKEFREELYKEFGI